MKVFLLPLYSQLNPGIGNCPLGCAQACIVKQKAPQLGQDSNYSCPLSLHQAQTYAEIKQGEVDVIFNTSATGDGKSLAAYLVGFLDPEFRIIGLYPTIELVTDQARQQIDYHQKFGFTQEQVTHRVDYLYGAELARRVEQAEKGNRFKELWLSLKHKRVILTNPDIFHLITYFRYQNPAYNRTELPITLARNPDLYVADEFHIFGVHQEAALLNSLLFIRYSRPRRRPMKFLFTSATPKHEFIGKLRASGFRVTTVAGNYVNEPTEGFRPISQPVELEFVELDKDADPLTWLTEQAQTIQEILEKEGQGRGLIILNSVALIGRAVRQLQALFPEERVKVREVSGRIDRRERGQTQADLNHAQQSVLVVGTSAVDVGVDFRIHLLIFEAGDSATFVQRFGRLGRHPGFSVYKAFVFLSSRTPWVKSRLQEKLNEGEFVSRMSFRDIIEDAFDPPREFQQYRHYWGALQAQGMLLRLSQGNANVMQQVQASMNENLRRVYGEQLDRKRGHWFALSNDHTGKAIQEELLRFRCGSDLQAAVWDGSRFYTYDLLRLLPHVEVEVIDRDAFLLAAQQFEHPATEFSEKYIQAYLKIQRWVDERFPIGLECDRGNDELKQCTLSLIDKLSITGHPQPEVVRCLRKQKLLTFLVQVNRHQPDSHWDVSRNLHLSPLFGLYRLKDGDEQFHACAFNQDALLLEALKWRIKRCENTKPYIF